MTDVMAFEQIDRTNVADVGGKAAQLGELTRIGIRVPPGFCVTTAAYRRMVAELPELDEQLDRLAAASSADGAAIRTVAADIRRLIEGFPIPADLVAAISESVARLGDRHAYAVRSSATAEDLPTASFAGQQDSYLGVVGVAEIVRHVRRCWASLFTERAVNYRRRNGFDDRDVSMAVIVQQMVSPTAAGILFTADPVTSNRRVAAVEAVPGLGDALAAGETSGDVYAVRDDLIVSGQDRTGGTLTDEQVLRLVRLGRRIEAHFGSPQDIEWCLVGEDFQIVQSRPITTLFPIPPVDDENNHVYISVGHQQMMTDAMKPLGLSVWQLTTPRPMAEAGGRLFVDVAPALATPAGRASLLDLAKSDPLIRDALQTVLDRGFVPSLPDPHRGAAPGPTTAPIETDPGIVTDLIDRNRTSVERLRRDIQTLSGPALFDFILDDLAELRRVLFAPLSNQAIMAGMEATWWLDEHLQEWLGEPNAAGVLLQSVPHNITSQMGLELLDVADTIRPHPQVAAFLQHVVDTQRGDDFLAELADLPGGPAARAAIRAFLDQYGVRCAGEIDVTRTRWSEQPATLLPAILRNVATFEPGAGRRRFEQGLADARHQAAELLTRLRALPDGERRAVETERMIDRARTFAGYREYPKYGMVSRYFAYKLALLREADRLVELGVLAERDDISYLRFDELAEVSRTQQVDHDLIRDRRTAYRMYETLIPPRVLTSEGEAITGSYRRDDLPPGALAGLAVSAGVAEGRARVVTDMTQADLAAGDILVTAYTDPSWTPLFLTAAGVVTEVGGLMTHGAVIAREYGLPAVVGVQNATRLIQDGQRIRIDGNTGTVEVLG